MNLLSHNFILYSDELQTHVSGRPLRYSGFFMSSTLGWLELFNPFFSNSGRCGVPARITGLTYVDFEAPSRCILLKLQKNIRTMKNSVDLNAYLVEVYLHTEVLQNPHTTDFHFDNFLKAFELWWQRCQECDYVPTSTTAHLVLSLVNMSVFLMEQKMDGVDLFQQRNRLNRIKSGLVQSMAKHLPECEQSPAA